MAQPCDLANRWPVPHLLLLPWNWAEDHPESIREYRQEERRERDVRKQTQRAKRRANKLRQSKLNRK